MLFWPLLLSLAGEALGRTPNTRACCAAAGVSDYCTENFCDVEKVPDYFTMFKVSAGCANHLGAIARCLADGRNHLPCCQSQSRDYVSCLHLCNGTQPAANTSTWSDSHARYRHGSGYGVYVSCLSFNLEKMFTCMLDGYPTGPFPPVSVAARLTGPTTVHVTWEPPEKLQDQVKEYVVFYRKTVGFIKTTDFVATQETSMTLRDLSPDTKYEVSVVAKAKTGLTDSLPSDAVVVVTKGVAPKVNPYLEEVLTGHHTIVTLVCNTEVYGSQHISDVTLEWFKFSGSAYHPIDFTRKLENNKPKFSRYSYLRKIRADGRSTFVLTLTISEVDSSDFGSYKCVSRNTFGEDSRLISVRLANTSAMPSKPKNATACCLSLPQNAGCEYVCDNSNRPRSTSLKCTFARSESILRCAIEGFDLTPCCLRERVPSKCMTFCDGTGFTQSTASIYQCFSHASSFTDCHLEALNGYPVPPSNVEAKASGSNAIHVSWNPGKHAERYTVYYRVGEGDWRSSDTGATSTTLRNLTRNGNYQIIVLSANRVGFSENSKPAYISLTNS